MAEQVVGARLAKGNHQLVWFKLYLCTNDFWNGQLYGLIIGKSIYLKNIGSSLLILKDFSTQCGRLLIQANV